MKYKAALLFLLLVMFVWVGVILYDGVKAESDQIQDFDVVGVENYLAEKSVDVAVDVTNPLTPLSGGILESDSSNVVSEIPHSQLQTESLKGKPFDYTSLPVKFDLQGVPFFSQAPDGNWNEPYQNACEEASILLAYYYVKGMNPSKKVYKKDLLNLMLWEQENLGHHKDTTIQEFLVLIKKYLNIENSYIMNSPTINDIKKVISEGKILIAPFRGKMIGNPHYALGGPDYHVMVIKGYDEKNFITQDVGTIRGKDWKYTYEIIMNAMSNGNKKQLNQPGKKVIVMW